jgi:hypothetical protein
MTNDIHELERVASNARRAQGYATLGPGLDPSASADDTHRRYMRQEALQIVVRAIQCGSSVQDLHDAIETVTAFSAGSSLRSE